MKRIAGYENHRKSGLEAEFVAEYRMGLAGIHYSGSVTFAVCPPSRQSGFMVWGRKSIPPGRAIERTMRESVQFLDVDKLLATRSES